MKIKKINIKNFRSLSDNDIIFYDLNKPITIIGENNAGKSNIIKALLYGIGHKYLGEDSLTESDFHNQNIEQSIAITITLEDEQGTNKQIDFKSSENYKDSPTLSTNRGTGYYSKNTKDPIINKIFYYDFQQVSNLLKIKTDFSYTPLGKIVKKIKDKFKADQALQDSMNDEIEKFINEQIANDEDYQLFKTKIGEKLKKNLKNHSEDFDFKHTIQDVDKIINGLAFFVKENTNKPLISVDHFGSGFRSLLVFSIFEAISESGEGGNIYVFEEPETFLHENFEEYFFELLKKLATNNQVIITTHSKKFVDIFNVGTIIRLCNNESTEHKTKHYQINLTTEQITNINNKVLAGDTGENLINFPEEYGSYMKAIEPNIGLIAFSEKVIIVEGPHDLLAYKTAFGKGLLAKEYISESLGYLGINIICVHNKDLIGPLMLICEKLKTKAFIIFDSDLPIDQIINEDDDYLQNPQSYKTQEPYSILDPKWKQHYTKTIKLTSIAKKFGFLYQINRPKIEGVLNFEIDDEDKLTYKNKSSLEVYNKLKDKNYEEIKQHYPNFISQDLEKFVFGPHEANDPTPTQPTT